jgi:hypothetical protein
MDPTWSAPILVTSPEEDTMEEKEPQPAKAAEAVEVTDPAEADEPRRDGGVLAQLRNRRSLAVAVAAAIATFAGGGAVGYAVGHSSDSGHHREFARPGFGPRPGPGFGGPRGQTNGERGGQMNGPPQQGAPS